MSLHLENTPVTVIESNQERQFRQVFHRFLAKLRRLNINNEIDESIFY